MRDSLSSRPAAAAPLRTGRPLDHSIFERIDAAIDSRAPKLVNLRRQMHAAPEASGQEVASTALVAKALHEAGLEPRIMRDGLGAVLDLDLGAGGDSFIALRAELDCVKVNDEKQSAFASVRPGLCHACGHDAHTAIVLGAALALHAQRDELGHTALRHNIRIIFQPAEENATGARSMIEQGALDNVQAILAVHVEPFMDVGMVGLRKGPLTSACKAFKIEVRGRSGHSARPFEAIDPIPAAANLVSMFYQLCPRSMDSRYPLALTVASINAGSSFNAIPDEAVITGTLRTARLVDLEAVQKKMQDAIEGVARATSCEIAIEFPIYAPATDNDPAIIDIMAKATSDLLGPQGVQWIDVPSLGAEDFAFYQERVAGAIVRLGAGLADRKQRRPLHSSEFDMNEAAIAVGAKFLSRAALLCATAGESK